MCIQIFSYNELSLRNVGKLHQCSKYSNVLYTDNFMSDCMTKLWTDEVIYVFMYVCKPQ